MSRILICYFISGCFVLVHAQPKLSDGAVEFSFFDKSASSVSLVGDFNGWARDDHRMIKDQDGRWFTTRKLNPGIYQYKFLVDGTRYELDSNNPAKVENYNK